MRRDTLTVMLLLCTMLAAGCGGGNQPAGGTPPSASNPPPAAPPPAAVETLTVSRYDAGPRASESPVDRVKAAAGEKLFTAKGCTVCHAFGKKVTGPDLAGVTKRRTAEWIENQILHPEVMTKEDPIARDLLRKHTIQMPNQKLTPDEARAVIEYFKLKDKSAGPAAAK
jgi:cytochrome c551/c552